MLRISTLMTFVVVALLGVSCNKSGYFSDLKEGDEAVKKIASIFLDSKTDKVAATLELQPNLDDCKAFFNSDAVAQKAFETYNKIFEDMKNTKEAISPKPEQSESIVVGATTEELLEPEWKGDLFKYFPGGFQTAAKNMKPGIKVYIIKFVEAGKDLGMRFDGFAYVNNHWKVFLKPWRVVE